MIFGVEKEGFSRGCILGIEDFVCFWDFVSVFVRVFGV